MIAEQPRRLMADEAEVILALRPLQKLSRTPFAGVAFHLLPEEMGQPYERKLFSEELVLRLISKGYLRATNATEPWPERGIPSRPSAVILDKAGEQVRNSLLKKSRTVVIDRDDA